MKRVVTSPPFFTNTYILRVDNELLVVDPGAGIGKHVNDEVSVILTHAHYDHIVGIRELKVKHVFVSPEDAEMLKNPKMNLSDPFGDPFVFDGTVLNLDEYFQTISAPGHTPGSRVVIMKNKVFTGDVIFCSSIGRTDLPGGNEELMKESLKKIRQFLETLPPNTPVFPGHMELCTVRHILDLNPFFNGTI